MLKSKWATQPDETDKAAAPAVTVAQPGTAPAPASGAQAAYAPVRKPESDPILCYTSLCPWIWKHKYKSNSTVDHKYVL